MLYNLLKYLLARPLARYIWRARLVHRERLPREGAMVLAANHVGKAETVMLPALTPRPMTFAAKAELFEGTSPWGRFSNWFLRAIHQVPLDRSGGHFAHSGLGTVESVLAQGGVVGIFPEGKRSPDGRLFRGHTGVARLALTADAPVVPIGFRHTDFRDGGWWRSVRRQAPEVVVGQPLHFDAATRRAFLDAPDRAAALVVLRRVTDQIMKVIQELTEQEYVPVYASEFTRRSLAEAPPDPPSAVG